MHPETLDQDREATAVLVDTLIEELERLPAQPSVAMRVAWLADDPSSSAKDLGAAIGADPSLTARVLKLANSAYYGLSGRVANVGFAVTVIGFPTVRAMAAAMASGLFEDAGQPAAPDGFWDHAVAVATACSSLAGRVGVRAADAFSLGLLHDLGSALLFRCDPDRFEAASLRAREQLLPLAVAEREVFGLSHDEAAARVFTAWRFPDDFVTAVANHHDALAASDNPCTQLLCAAEAVCSRLPMASRWEPADSVEGALAAVGLSTYDATTLARAVKEEAAQLVQAFS